MTKKSHNAYGVPWFARPDTPPIRPRTIPELSQEQLDRKAAYAKTYKARKAAKAAAFRYVHEYINENWKEGDRFILSKPVDLMLHGVLGLTTNPEYYDDQEWITYSGTFIGKQECGRSYFIKVKLDEGQKPPKNGSRFGMFVFFHLAEKIL